MSKAKPVFSLEEALIQIERHVKAGELEAVRETVRMGLALIPNGGIAKIEPRWRDFDVAFVTACRKNGVRAAWFALDFEKDGSHRAHVKTGGESGMCAALDAVVAAGLHAITEQH